MSALLDGLGCTVCSSDVGQQVRATILEDHFLMTLGSVAAPFPILLLGLAAFHFGLPPFRGRTARESPNE